MFGVKRSKTPSLRKLDERARSVELVTIKWSRTWRFVNHAISELEANQVIEVFCKKQFA